MKHRALWLAIAVGWCCLGARATEIPEGIPRALAQQRAARVSEVHYRLGYTLVPHAAAAAGTVTIRFRLKDAGQPLLLDFRDGQLQEVRLNGAAVPAEVPQGMWCCRRRG